MATETHRSRMASAVRTLLGEGSRFGLTRFGLAGAGLVLLLVCLLAVLLWPVLALVPLDLPSSYGEAVIAGLTASGLLLGAASLTSSLF